MYFAIIQLLYHVNALVNKCLSNISWRLESKDRLCDYANYIIIYYASML